MEKKSIGQFIAALRKANGYTQQEVADRLAVSNKAVSRWERDECAPDISVIPALAELLGVTCDELLRGERIANPSQMNHKGKVEKQIKTYINRTIVKYINMFLIAIGVAMFGLVWIFFSLSYTFVVLLEFVALIITMVAVNQMRAEKLNNDLFEKVGDEEEKRYNYCLARYSFAAFLLATEVIVLAFVKNYYVKQVLLNHLVLNINEKGFILLLCILVPLIGIGLFQKPYEAWVTGREYHKEVKILSPCVHRMNILRNVGLVVIFVLFKNASIFDSGETDISLGYYLIRGIAYSVLAIMPMIMVAVWIKRKELRKELTLPTVRNVLMMLPSIAFAFMSRIDYQIIVGDYKRGKYTDWNAEYAWIGVVGIALVWLIFYVIEKIRVKRENA